MRHNAVDLTPFGLTPTESVAYGALLNLGPSTGYAVAAACRRARANAYSALEGLVARGAALRDPGPPVRYRAVGPDALLARLAADQAKALDQLDQVLKAASGSQDHIVDTVAGRRPVAAVVLRLAGRAAQAVQAVLPAWLITDTVPAWRRAAASLTLRLWVLDPPDGWSAPVPTTGVLSTDAWRDTWPAPPVLLLADARHALGALDAPEGPAGWWGSHPALVATTTAALNWITRGSPGEQ